MLPGDQLFVPDKRPREEAASTGKQHVFVRRGVIEVLRIYVEDMLGMPREEVPYTLTIDGRIVEGVTGSEGLVTVSIPPNAQSGSLVVGDVNDDEGRQEYDLDLGHLDPIGAATGVQQRLLNLGFDCGPADGIIGPRTAGAIALFQAYSGLEPTGELDSRTVASLTQDHKS